MISITELLKRPIVAGGKSMADRMAQLAQENAQLRKENQQLREARDYWAQQHDHQLMACNQFEDEYQKSKMRVHELQRRLDNSRPSSKTIAQAQAEYQLRGIN